MRKMTWLVLGLALLAGAESAAAQEKTVRPKAGYIGIRYDDRVELITPADRRSDQVIIREVSKDSPAEKAGLKSGDEIVRINGMSVASGKFTAVARTLTEGDTVRLRIKRADRERDVVIVAAPRPAGSYTMFGGDRTIVFSADSVRGLMRLWMDSARMHLDSMKLPRVFVQPGDSSFDIRIERFGGDLDTLVFRRDTTGMRVFRRRFDENLPPDVFRHLEGDLGPGVIFRTMELGGRALAGAEFTDLDPGMKTYFGTDRGLLTLRVAPETPAARAGLQAGDIIKKANGRDVTRVTDLRSHLRESAGALKLEILRKGETRNVEIKTRQE